MCDICAAFGLDSDGAGYVHGFSAEAVEMPDGSGLPAFSGAGASGAPLETLPGDRLYAVATAVASSAMDRLVRNSDQGPARNFTYQFETAKPLDMPGAYSGYTLVAFSEEQKAIMRGIFADIQTLTNLTFTETIGAADADISLMRGNLESSYGGRGRFVYNYSTFGGQQTVTNYDGFAIFNQTRSLTTPNDLTLLYHEIGHALTLRHPGNVDINPANAPPPPYLPAGEDSYKFTVMSYNASAEYAARPDSYMLYDVAALQYRFGANMATRAGNTSYSTVSGPPDIIWDGGGNDTLDGSQYAMAQYLDLRPGAFSTLGSPTQADTMAIAFGAVIENAFGGGGADTLVGSSGDNWLAGLGGADALRGGAGRDTLTGGTGSDTLDGGDGADLADFADRTEQVAFNLLINMVVVGGTEFDSLLAIENGRGGSGQDFMLGNDLANQLEGGAGGDNVWGFGGDDSLFGDAGDDIVVGGPGNDALHGGQGKDWLYGQEGNDAIFGTATSAGGFNVLVGGDGADTMEGGTSGFDYFYDGVGVNGVPDAFNDSFVIRANTGIKVMNSFENGGVNDVVRLIGTGLTSFAQVQANLSFSGVINGTVLVVDATTQVWFLNGTQPANLAASDFQFG
jgi:serralysin